MRDTIDMAREAGGWGYIHDAGDEPYKWQFTPAQLQAFEALIRADEREACAKVCDELHDTWRWDDWANSASGSRDCAAAIRNRGNT
jgi:hypothetical protein